MRKFAFLAIALVVVGALVGARFVGAQENPGPGLPAICTDSNYDFNHDGLLSQGDAAAWKALAAQCIGEQGFVSTESCRQILGDAGFDLADVNGDGVVDASDHSAVGERLFACFPRLTRLPR